MRKRSKMTDIAECTLKQNGNGPDIEQQQRTTDGPNAVQSGNKGDGRDHGGDRAEENETT